MKNILSLNDLTLMGSVLRQCMVVGLLLEYGGGGGVCVFCM